MPLFKNLERLTDVSDAISILQGDPIGLTLRLLPIFFRGRKNRRLSKAQLRKLRMMMQRRYVDQIVMEHERIHRKNRQDAIDQAKERSVSHKKPHQQIIQNGPKSPSLTHDRAAQFTDRTNPTQTKSPQKIIGEIGYTKGRTRHRYLTRILSDGSSRAI